MQPLNLFLYTWRFLAQLEVEAKHKVVKNIYKWFARVSIIIVPVSFLVLVPYYCFAFAKWTYYLNTYINPKETQHYNDIKEKLFHYLQVLSPSKNLLSCLILMMVLVLVLKLSRKVKVGK
jgi:hypothetical protein